MKLNSGISKGKGSAAPPQDVLLSLRAKFRRGADGLMGAAAEPCTIPPLGRLVCPQGTAYDNRGVSALCSGYPKLEPSPMCPLQGLPSPSSALASFPTAPASPPLSLSRTHSPGNGDIGARWGPSAQSCPPSLPKHTLGCPFLPSTALHHGPVQEGDSLWQGLLFIFVINYYYASHPVGTGRGWRAPGAPCPQHHVCPGAEGRARPPGVGV